MPSVSIKLGALNLSPAQNEARDRLTEAENVLQAGGSQAATKAARLAKLAALVDLDLFSPVIQFAESENLDEIPYLAYGLYRLGKLEELRELARGKSHLPIGVKLAVAQAEYKAGNLQAAREQLLDCRGEVEREDDNDIVVNLSAINALVGLQSSEVTSFDEAFNNACALLVRGLPLKALDLLQQANGLAEEEDDRQAVIVQAAYAHLISGNNEEASKLLRNFSSLTDVSHALKCVISNNRVAATYQGGDLIAAHRALLSFDDFSKSVASAELNANQRQIIQRNQLKLLARAGIHTSLRRSRRHSNEFPNDVEPLSVAYHFTKSLKQIRKAANEGDKAAAICLTTLENKEWTYASEDKDIHLGDFGSLATATLLASAASTHGLENYFDSLELPELTKAGHSLLNPDQEIGKDTLVSIDKLVSSMDVKSLNQNPPSSSFPAVTSVGQSGKRKRSGKRKLPADFDPKRVPDPERWLAKQDRSDYKPKKKKASQATQGSASAVVADEPPVASSQVVGAKPKKKNKKKGKK